MTQLVVDTLDDGKGSDITVIDVAELTSVTDNMIIVTGRSDRHNRSLADKVIVAAKENGITPLMIQDARDFYNLEALWTARKADSADSEAVAH